MVSNKSPNDPPRRRARSLEAKAARRRAILDAALVRYEQDAISDITMAQLGADVGIVKGTLYVYFRTKEDLFLALAEQLLGEWFDDLDESLRGTTRLSTDQLRRVVVGSVRSRPLLQRLLADLGSLIEPNVPYEDALRFKWRLGARLTATGTSIERRTPFLRQGGGTRVLNLVQALIAGLHRLAEPAPVMRRILEAPGMEALRVDFDRDFDTAVAALLAGLERTA
ncbi:MAG TPA: TetR family transcriptional regulator [Gemmatimonadales bacterium]